MPNIRQLMAFQAVIVYGTQTRAAEKLRLSQPAVSTLIESLEEELGFKLFERAKGRLIPSKEASYYYDFVAGLLASLSNLDQVAKDIREANTGALHIAANPSMSLGFLPKALASFHKSYPEIKISLCTRSSPKVIELISTQQFDLGLAEVSASGPLIETEKFRLRCVCVVPVGHALAGANVIYPKDLDKQQLISIHREHMTSARLVELFASCGVSPEMCIETELFWTSCQFSRAGLGIAVVDPITALDFRGDGVVVIPFEPAVYVEMGMLFPTSRPKSLPVLEFARHARSTLAKALSELERSFCPGAGPLLHTP